jgi:hypothetical protein
MKAGLALKKSQNKNYLGLDLFDLYKYYFTAG